MVKYFLDTYALIAIVQGNKNYAQYSSTENYTTLFNLYELFYCMLRDFDQETAKRFFYQFIDLVLPIQDLAIFNAAQFKLEHKKANVSYVDALGYIIAKEIDALFVTGDRAFEHMENVAFVK